MSKKFEGQMAETFRTLTVHQHRENDNNRAKIREQLHTLFQMGKKPENFTFKDITRLLGIDIQLLEKYEDKKDEDKDEDDEKNYRLVKNNISGKVSNKVRVLFNQGSWTDVLKTLYAYWLKEQNMTRVLKIVQELIVKEKIKDPTLSLTTNVLQTWINKYPEKFLNPETADEILDAYRLKTTARS